MMNKFSIVIGRLLLLVLVQPSFATAPRMSVLKLAGDVPAHLVAYEYPPLVTGDTANPGAAVEIVTQAFLAGGKPIAVENFPSKKFALQLLSDDTKVIAILADARSLSKAERKSLSEDKILNLIGHYFFYRPGGKDLDHVNDLNGLKGLIYGAISEDATDKYEQAGIQVIIDEPKLLLRKLQSKEIDFISAYATNAEWLIDRLFPDQKEHFAMMPLIAWESSFSIGFDSNNKATKEWRAAFNEGFKKIRKNGVYNDILKKYGVESATLK